MVDYKALLSELRKDEAALRARFEKELAEVRGAIAYAERRASESRSPKQTSLDGIYDGGPPFRGMSIAAAAEKLLTDLKKPLKTGDIADALVAGGIETTAKNFSTAVYTTLRRGDAVFVVEDGTWSLAEWE